MQKYAAIDIGTNSMRLLLAEIKDGKIINRKKYINPTRIGGSVDKNKLISEDGIERNIQALHSFSQKAKEYGAEKILAIATSAVRDAANGKEFVERAYKTTGIKIDTISGEEEAALGYKGVVMGLSARPLGTVLTDSMELNQKNRSCGHTLVIDIGGGSTELILGQGPTRKSTTSLNIGAVRMTERWITTHPVSKEEHIKMVEDINKISKEAIEKIKEELGKSTQAIDSHCNKTDAICTHLIGIGGTITTLAALHQQLDPYDPDKVHNYKLRIEDINILKEKLLTLTVEEIKNQKGIHPKRADIITAGTIILHTLMNNLNIKEITVSEYDNLEGLVHNNI